jgi:hypothetical protein
MEKIDGKSIRALISFIMEQVTASVGDDSEERIIIKPGLKLRNKESGINYTVSKTSTDEDTLLIHCIRPADNGDGWFEIVFPRDKLEDYVLL